MSYYIVICGLSVHNFSMLTRQGHDFQGGGEFVEYEMRILIVSTNFV